MKKNLLDIAQAQLDENGLAITDGWISVYNTSHESREYIGINKEYLAIGVGLPAGGYIDPPPFLKGDNEVVRRTEEGKAWEIVADLRGNIAYSTETRQPELVNTIGPLPGILTLLSPQTAYDYWDGIKWITDTEEQHVAAIQVAEDTQKQLLNEVTASIAPLQDAVDINMAMDDEKKQLTSLKTYRVLLNRIDLSTAPDIEWPVAPLS
ncbi:tail fiber assembly protein [Yersinia enterocolitica]|nr:tail fiber assembly protein [Yersinia enterocolitica]